MEQAQSSPPLCNAGCGFYGSAQTEGMCSKCYKLIGAKQPAAAQLPVRSSHDEVKAQSSNSIETIVTELREEVATKIVEDVMDVASSIPAAAPAPKKRNRCNQCNKKVGLTGFECRCGGVYCSEHRYDTEHECSFDYKTAEREAIRKNNPVVACEKIQRI